MANAVRVPNLHKNEFGDLLDALPILVSGIENGKIAWINGAGTKILGAASAAELIGRPLTSFLAPDYRHLVQEGFGDWLSESWPLPLLMKQVTGAVLDVEASVRPLTGAQSALLIAHDVTDKKQAALGLLERERRISAVLHNVADGIVEFDENGRILAVNETTEAIFGYTIAELTGARIDALLGNADSKTVGSWRPHSDLTPRAAESHVRSEELVALRKDGGLFPVTLTYSEFATDKGSRFIGAIRLVTEREALEQTLLDTAARFRHFAESASDWFWETDSELRFTYVSDQFSKINQISQESVIGRTREELASRPETEDFRAHLEDIKNHRPFKEFTYTVGLPNGSEAHFRLSGKPVFDHTNAFVGYRGTGRNVTTEIEAQSKAHAAETLLIDAIESISEGLILYDADDRLVRTNSRYKAFYIDLAELLVPGMHFEDWIKAIYEHDVVVKSTGSIDDWIAKRRMHRLELEGSIEVELSDGRWIRIAERPIQNGGVVGVHTEITKLKHAEFALRQNAEQFQNLFEDLIQGVVIHDGFKPLFVNQALARTFGYESPKALLGLDSIEHLFAPEEQKRIAAMNSARLAGETVPSLCEFRGVRRDGSYIWLEDTGSVIDWNGQKVLQSIIVDISERKQQEHALRESEARLRDVIDNAPLKIGLTDSEGRYILVNSLFARALNSEPDTIRGKTAADLFPVDIAETESADNRQVLETRRAVVRELDTMGPEGRRFEQSVKFPITGPDGATAGIGVMITDLTEQQQFEEHLRESQKLNALGQLAGGVAHDFNNLLMVIGGFAKRAWSNADDSVQVKASLAEVITAADKAAGLTKQLLTFGRRQVLEKKVFRAASVLHELRTMLQPLLGETIEMTIDIADETACVEADPSLLSQALVNLAINARDAMSSGGALQISLSVVTPDAEMLNRHGIVYDGRFLKFSVEDHGVGMNAQTAARIFEPFFTTKEQGKGVGLGMAMVYGFVKQSGGFIDIESELGVGTTVSIYLHLVEKQPKIDVKISADFASLAGETILLAEDDDALRRLTQLNLEELGYRVLAASDGVHALEIEEDHDGPIHLLLSDIVMPALGGIELARILRQSRPEVKVILVSGYPARGDNSDVLSPDEFALLQKPITLDTLAAAIRASLTPQANDEMKPG